METVRFRCKECKTQFEAPKSDAGAKVNCPGCDRQIEIPEFNEPEKIGMVEAFFLFLGAMGLLGWLVGFICRMTPETGFPLALITGIMALIGMAYFAPVWKAYTGEILLTLGFLGLGICVFTNLLIGAIASGFVAVIGAIFLVAKKMHAH